MRNDSQNNHNICRGFPMPATVATSPADVVRGILNANFGVLRGGTKKLANAAGVSINTSENWLRGRSSPSLENLIPLLANCDALVEAINALINERKAKCSGDSSQSRLPLGAGSGVVPNRRKSDLGFSSYGSDAAR